MNNSKILLTLLTQYKESLQEISICTSNSRYVGIIEDFDDICVLIKYNGKSLDGFCSNLFLIKLEIIEEIQVEVTRHLSI